MISGLVLLHPAIEKGITLLVLQFLVLECSSILFEFSRKRVLSPSWMILTIYDAVVQERAMCLRVPAPAVSPSMIIRGLDSGLMM